MHLCLGPPFKRVVIYGVHLLRVCFLVDRVRRCLFVKWVLMLDDDVLIVKKASCALSYGSPYPIAAKMLQGRHLKPAKSPHDVPRHDRVGWVFIVGHTVIPISDTPSAVLFDISH